MTNLKMTNQVLCKMTDLTLKMTNLLAKLYLTSLRHLTFHVVFDKTLGGIEDGQVS